MKKLFLAAYRLVMDSALTDRNIRPRVHVLDDVTGVRIESKNILENPPCEICERSGRLASLFCPRKSAILNISVA